MATPPTKLQVRKEDFPETGIDSPEALEKLLRPLLNHSQSVSSALTGGLTFGQNMNAEIKDVNVTTPASAWIAPTLNAGWTNFGSNNEPAGYFLDSFGWVHIRGLVTHAGAGTVFTLPAAYWPEYQVNLATAVSTGGTEGYGRLRVKHDTGDVDIASGSPSTWGSITCSYPSNGFTPGVLSCFPFSFTTKVVQPQGVFLLKVTDTSSSPATIAAQGLTWTLTTDGKVQVTNLPGLLLGKTYSLRMLVVGG
jgi:hypothetical protein